MGGVRSKRNGLAGDEADKEPTAKVQGSFALMSAGRGPLGRNPSERKSIDPAPAASCSTLQCLFDRRSLDDTAPLSDDVAVLDKVDRGNG